MQHPECGLEHLVSHTAAAQFRPQNCKETDSLLVLCRMLCVI